MVWLGVRLTEFEGREAQRERERGLAIRMTLPLVFGQGGSHRRRAGAKWTSHGSLIDKAPNIPPSLVPSPSFASLFLLIILVYTRIF